MQPETVQPVPSLRERKKAKTRAALIEASQRLFARQGYTGTTLEDISAEVDITTQTLLRYFDSKAQLALAPLAAHLGEIERFLQDEHRTVDTLSAWRRYLQLEAEEATNPSESTTATYVANLRTYDAWVDKDPLLVASLSGIERELQEILATALARDAGVRSDDLHSTLVAALLVAGRRTIWDRWLARIGDTDSLVEDLRRMRESRLLEALGYRG
ncbi:MAG: TetR family transcriptional regulator [Deltaproteobacteria bacterium]|nr:TetR family transcriptional regulator [Deltaproteobacteria bacterium]